MPDEQQELRRINLAEAFPFTQLFRSFRLAIHPHKLVLALVALAMTCALGWVMDLLWPDTAVMPSKASPMLTMVAGRPPVSAETHALLKPTPEIRAYLDRRGKASFCDWCETAREACTERQAGLLRAIKPDVKKEDARQLAGDGKAEDEIWTACENARQTAERILEAVYKNIEKADKSKREALFQQYETVAVLALVGPTEDLLAEQAMPSLAKLMLQKVCTKEEGDKIRKAIEAQVVGQNLCDIEGRGIFATLLDHEIQTFNNSVGAMLALDVGIGTKPPMGLKAAFVDAVGGIVWFFGTHWFYAAVFTVLTLIIWSFAGGAICRVAALHAARDEKISWRQSLKFSGRKLASFFAAPLLPVALLVAVGLFLVLGGVVGMIPYVGEIIAGLLWPLALCGGFVLALVVIATVSGTMLMYPTIAVEGSDAFDALSRSFSYVFSKPWRTAFYVLVSGLYGAICYLFVRLFAHLVLNLTHMAVGLTMNVDGSAHLPETVGKLEAMWARTPLLEAGRFFGNFDQYPLNGPEAFGSCLIWIWTFVVVGLVVSFAISFFFSASTMIYYLLRREVDATDIEDVYLEEYEEEIAPVTAPPAEVERPAEEPADQAEGEPPTDSGDEAPQQDAESGGQDQPAEGNEEDKPGGGD